MDIDYDNNHWELVGTDLIPLNPPREMVSGLTDAQSEMLLRLYQERGLDLTAPVALSGDGINTRVIAVDGVTVTHTRNSVTRT